MTHKNAGPPRWIERILGFAVRGSDRETVSGDLLEEYREERLPRHGRRAANFWYVRQALSIATVAALRGALSFMQTASIVLCLFCVASASWLAWMESVLHHPRYIDRMLFDILIALQCVSGLVAQRLPRWVVFAGAAAVFFAAVNVLTGVLTATHFEGYAVIISGACIFETVLTALSSVFPPDLPIGRTN